MCPLGLVEDLLRVGYAVRFVATGHSMEPSILSAAEVTVAPLAAGARGIRPGDVVLAMVRGRLRVHRVRRLVGLPAGLLVMLRGDNQQQDDSPVPLTAVLGKVVHVKNPPLPAWAVVRVALRSWMRRAATASPSAGW